jgi:hypothetical protein
MYRGLALVASVGLTTLISLACTETKIVPASPTVIVVTPTPATGATVQPSPGEAGSRERPVPTGEAYLMSTGWLVTVVDVDHDVRTGLDFNGDGVDEASPPHSGNKFFMVTLRANNVSAGNPGSFPYGMEEAFALGPDGTLYGVGWPGVPGPLGGETLEGGTLEGPLPFYMPVGATASIMMLGRGEEARFFALD